MAAEGQWVWVWGPKHGTGRWEWKEGPGGPGPVEKGAPDTGEGDPKISTEDLDRKIEKVRRTLEKGKKKAIKAEEALEGAVTPTGKSGNPLTRYMDWVTKKNTETAAKAQAGQGPAMEPGGGEEVPEGAPAPAQGQPQGIMDRHAAWVARKNAEADAAEAEARKARAMGEVRAAQPQEPDPFTTVFGGGMQQGPGSQGPPVQDPFEMANAFFGGGMGAPQQVYQPPPQPRPAQVQVRPQPQKKGKGKGKQAPAPRPQPQPQEQPQESVEQTMDRIMSSIFQ